MGADGVLSVAGGAVATVGVFKFPAGTQLIAEGANRYVTPPGVAMRAFKERRSAPGKHRGRKSRCNPGNAGPDDDAASGGDDAEDADNLPHRFQQVRQRGSASRLGREISAKRTRDDSSTVYSGERHERAADESGYDRQ